MLPWEDAGPKAASVVVRSLGSSPHRVSRGGWAGEEEFPPFVPFDGAGERAGPEGRGEKRPVCHGLRRGGGAGRSLRARPK